MTDPKNQTNTDATAELPPVDDYANATEALREKLTDAQTPGYQAEFDPEEAERAGAFVEDALSEEDAADSNADLVEVDGALEPAFLDDEGPSADIPPFIITTNARELYDLRPGETVPEAIARHNAKELTEQDAAESGDDLAALTSLDDDQAPAFITEGGPSEDLPAFVHTTNIRELYDWKPGESLDEAIARKKAQQG